MIDFRSTLVRVTGGQKWWIRSIDDPVNRRLRSGGVAVPQPFQPYCVLTEVVVQLVQYLGRTLNGIAEGEG